VIAATGKRLKTTLNYESLNVSVNQDKRGLSAQVAVDLPDNGKIDAQVALVKWQLLTPLQESQPLQGHLTMILNDLQPASALFPDVQNLKGKWHSEFDLTGSLKDPNLAGFTRLSIHQTKVPVLGIDIKDANIVARSKEGPEITVKGKASSGKGFIEIDGALEDYRVESLLGELKITGKDFNAVRLPEAEINISPNLTLSVDKQMANLQGELTIPFAELRVFDQGGGLSPSSDVVVVNGQKEEKKQPPIKFRSKVRVTLGDKVNVSGYGFNGKITGSIVVTEAPEQLTTATGELQVAEGKYNAFGVELEISEGRLSYTGGALDNPTVSIRAIRKTADDTVAGVLISGQAQSPELTLFSDPPMQDANILSYLVLGRPLDQASDQEGAQLSQAALSLGLVGGEKLAKELGDQFGLDEVTIESSRATQDTSLVLGKYLSPKLYVRYAIGIGQTVNTLNIHYQLADRWVLKSESGAHQSADLLFTIEKD
jgi:translocation and assembly module TamB